MLRFVKCTKLFVILHTYCQLKLTMKVTKTVFIYSENTTTDMFPEPVRTELTVS